MPDSPNPANAAPLWSDAEKRTWAPPENLTNSQWAEKYRRLPKTNPLGDKWHNDNSPLLVIVMVLAGRPGIREIWLMKAVQVGGTAVVHNILGHDAHLDPCPILVVMPNEEDGRKQIRGEIFPMFRETEPLAALRIGNYNDEGRFVERRSFFKSNYIRLLNGFEMHLGYSGSPASLASRPFKKVFLDETDKYEPFAGKEASPVDLARVRVRKFSDGPTLIIGWSTPTTSDGIVATEHGDCEIQLRAYVPCPHCGHLQALHQDQLKWDHSLADPDPKKYAAAVVEHKAAWFECIDPACRKPIRDEHKRQIVPQGCYATENMNWRLYPDGHEEGEKPPGSRVGLHYPAFYDYQVHWYDVAADMIRAGKDPAKLMALYNSTFGEPFKIKVEDTQVSTFAVRCVARDDFQPPPAGIVPPWASRLLLTVDTQKDYFWFVVRAWGWALRSQRIVHGRLQAFEQIEELLYRTRWHYANEVAPPIGIYRMGIDSGGGLADGGDDVDFDSSRTDQVYRWCNKDPLVRLALKGSSKPMEQPVRWKKSLYSPPGAKDRPYERTVHLIDGGYCRDLLASQIAGTVPVVNPETGELVKVLQFGLNDQNDEEYNRHMANVAKIMVTHRGKKIAAWRRKTIGARKDYHDVEAYQQALAVGMSLCTNLPTLEQLQQQAIAAAPPKAVSSGVKSRDGRSFFAHKR